MTPEDPESRRIADELKRRERQRPATGASVDPDTLKAMLEQYTDAVVKLVGPIEKTLAKKIDTLAEAQGGVAESLRHEIKQVRKGGDTDKAAALERQLWKEQRAAMEGLSNELKQKLDTLTESLDKREGGVFAGIDDVAESVRPAAHALKELQEAVASTAAVAGDVAAIRKVLAGGVRVLDDVATIRETVTRNSNTINDVVKMKPVLDGIQTSIGTWSRSMRRLRWLGWVGLILIALLFSAGGVALQRETGIWTPLADVENRDRDEVWERYGEQIITCRDAARKRKRAMACTIVDMDP